MSARSFRRAREREVERGERRERGLRSKAAIAAGVGLGATVLFAPAADAATFTVTSLADTDELEGTLREEIEDANDQDGDDTIVFQAGLTGTITLTAASNGAIEIYNDSLDIQGPGASQISVAGDGLYRIFTAYDFDEVTDDLIVSGLTLRDGFANDGGALYTFRGGGYAPHLTIANSILTGNEADTNGSNNEGGAVNVLYGPLTVTNSTFTDNHAGGEGGGIALYGADEDGAGDTRAVTISGSVFSGNTSGEDGAGAQLYNAWDDVLIETTTFSGNSAGQDGGGLALYGNEDDVPTTIRQSTFTGNSAEDSGGGMVAWGAQATTRQPGPFLVENSTFSGNTAAYYGGGIYSYNSDDTPRTIRNSTITGNTAGTDPSATSDNVGGGVHAYLFDNVGAGADEDTLTISSSIIANNTPQDLGDNSLAPPEGSIEVGFSLIEVPGSSLIVESPAGSNLTGVDPQLGPLASNGGPTQTHAPAATSPAIDAGIANGLTTDQRGAQRTLDASNVANRPGSDGTDIGSVELLPGGRLALAQCKGATESPLLFAPGAPIVGTDANDVIVGTAANDSISSGKGKDKVCAGSGNDGVKAGAGKDNVSGQAGKDKLKGNGGNDKLQGNAGKDTLKGGGGKDTLKGGGGKDKLVGGPGKDVLKGGGGKDSERQ